MSSTQQEKSITERVAERPSLDLRSVRKVRPRDMGVRFIAGAITSIAAGLMTIALGARVAGAMLAFPAILAASLTLIDEQEDSAEAREDARGAAAGGGAMAAFAAVAALCFGVTSDAIALLLATVAWFATAFLVYFVAWFR